MINSFQNKFLLRAAAFLTGCCFVCGCENSQSDIRKWTDKVVMTEEATNVESMLSQRGHLRAQLKAPLMKRFFSDTIYSEFPKSLHCDFYNEQKEKESWLDAKYGKYFENLGKVYLRDSVIVITTKGDTLRTPELWWDQNRKLFYTDKVAAYTGPDKRVTGTIGLEATQDLSSIIFKYPVGTMKTSANGFPE